LYKEALWKPFANASMTPEQQPKQESAIAATDSNSLVLGLQGLYSAIVIAIQPDSGGQIRVQITVKDFKQANMWAYLAQPYATSATDMYVYPEVGDQVIVGFLGGASDSPVIIGSLHNKNRAIAYIPDAKSSKKAIVTTSRLSMEFDDGQKSITLRTPAGNELIISDAEDNHGLSLTDQQNNTITMSEQGVSIVSKSTLSLQADQDITIESMGGNVTLKANQNLRATADIGLMLKGITSAELSASGETTVKGVMVIIN
jgi:uncharacterized protein involved in type VI secretion and phage assembly